MLNKSLFNCGIPEPHIELSSEVRTEEDASTCNGDILSKSVTREVDFLIIGAGPTGLGAAYKLRKESINDFLIIDRSKEAGGLASSFKDPKGFWWDVGGHVQFSHYHQFDSAMLECIPSDMWLQHQRVSAVRIYDCFVPYFFQNNIGFLPQDARERCLNGLEKLKNCPPKTITNFKEWIEASFGEGIAEEFMLPYNFKVWAYPPEDLSHRWVGDRVATVDLSRIKENILHGRADVSWGPNSTFGFPLQGGTGQIWRSMSDLIQKASPDSDESIRFNTNVNSVDAKRHLVRLDNGEIIKYKHLISTMPLDKLTSILNVDSFPCSQEIHRYTDNLKHSSTHIIGIGLEGVPKDELKEMCWMYFPEKNSDFYRVTLFSKYSPNNVPSKGFFYSLMCEVSESPAKLVDKQYLVRRTVEGLINTKLISADESIVSTWQYSVKYGYPTPSVERDAVLAKVIPELDRNDIYSRGRFGGWKYEVGNQDHSFAQGYEVVQRILEKREEFTYKPQEGYDPNSFLSGGKKLDLESRIAKL